jgi:hypothetical protein
MRAYCRTVKPAILIGKTDLDGLTQWHAHEDDVLGPFGVGRTEGA